MKVTNVLNCSNHLDRDKEALTVESIQQQSFERKAVRITIKGNGITMAVNVYADELTKAIENASNH